MAATLIISYENVFAFDLHSSSGDKAVTITLILQHRLKNDLTPLEHQFHEGPLLDKCQDQSQTCIF